MHLKPEARNNESKLPSRSTEFPRSFFLPSFVNEHLLGGGCFLLKEWQSEKWTARITDTRGKKEDRTIVQSMLGSRKGQIIIDLISIGS